MSTITSNRRRVMTEFRRRVVVRACRAIRGSSPAWRAYWLGVMTRMGDDEDASAEDSDAAAAFAAGYRAANLTLQKRMTRA